MTSLCYYHTHVQSCDLWAVDFDKIMACFLNFGTDSMSFAKRYATLTDLYFLEKKIYIIHNIAISDPNFSL